VRISPEARFITLCVGEPDTAPGHAIAAAAAARDWEAVVATAARHGVAAWVGRAAALPADAGRGLDEMVYEAFARVMLLNAELERAAGALAAAAIPVIVLKGPGLARTIYPDALLRPYGDVDLSVQDRHADAAAATLLEAGFAEVPFEAEEARHAHAGHVHEAAAFHRMFTAPGTQALIELHADPFQLGLRPTGEAARWRRAVPVPHLPSALMLCPEDQLVQLSVHAHKHGFSRLIWLKDLDLLLRTYGNRLDWSRVATAARQEGVGASVWYTLRLTAALLGAPVPRPVLARLRPAPPLRALYELVWPAGDAPAFGSSTTTSDFSASHASRSRIAHASISSPAQTASAASGVQPPLKAPSRRRTTRSCSDSRP
jgi:putative nucleotidyltransferase-like protein